MIDLHAITPLALDPNLNQDGVFIPFKDEIIVMQSTGLTDKNGKEIWEGDILQGAAFGVVVFSYGKFTGCYISSDSMKGWDYAETWENDISRMKVEVIGNIYENPELLGR